MATDWTEANRQYLLTSLGRVATRCGGRSRSRAVARAWRPSRPPRTMSRPSPRRARRCRHPRRSRRWWRPSASPHSSSTCSCSGRGRARRAVRRRLPGADGAGRRRGVPDVQPGLGRLAAAPLECPGRHGALAAVAADGAGRWAGLQPRRHCGSTSGSPTTWPASPAWTLGCWCCSRPCRPPGRSRSRVAGRHGPPRRRALARARPGHRSRECERKPAGALALR